MSYDEELRSAEIRNNKRNVEARKKWYGPEDLPKTFTLPDDMEEMIDNYWYSLKSANISWRTVKTYYNVARKCTKALMDAGMNYRPELVGMDEMEYLRDVYFIELATKTKRGYLCSYGKFLRLHGNDIARTNGFIWNGEMCRYRVDWLEDDEIEKLLNTPDLTDTERLALHLMLRMGLRRSEIIRLRIEDVYPDGIIVCGKSRGGGTFRFVPFVSGVAELLEAVLRDRERRVRLAMSRHEDYVPEPYVFMNRLRKPTPYCLEGNGFDKSILDPIREKSGIHFHGNHTLRRTFARKVYYRDMSPDALEALAKYLGHSSVSQTKLYIGVTDDKIRSVAAIVDW